MSPRRFIEQVQAYTVLLLSLDEYQASERALQDGFEFLEPGRYEQVRDQEKHLLQQVFDDWVVPYSRKLAGWRADSPVFVVKDSQLVGGVYLCDANEFDRAPLRGQLHYFFVDPAFRAHGIHGANVREAVRRARAWGLKDVYVNTDRYLLPEVYVRWGARPVKQITKPSRLPHNRAGDLARTLWRQARRVSRNLRS